MKRVTALAVMLLAGCADKPDPVPPSVIEVSVPVMVKCDIRLPDRPSFAVDSLRIGSSIDAQMRALRAERHQRIGYEVLLRAEIEKCKR